MRRTPAPLFIVIGTVAAALLCASSALAQEEARRLTGVVSGKGFTPIRLAVPAFRARPDLEEPAREMVEALRSDLRFAGYFDLVDPSLFSLVPSLGKDKVAPDEWIAIGADAVLLCNLAARGGRWDLVARLYDNPSRSLVFSYRYGGRKELVRRMAHEVADALVRHYTGRPGVAKTRIAFVSAHGAGKELYLMDYDGRRIRRLTTTGTINLSPVWSPDGEKLAFVSWRGRQPAIYIYRSDGTLSSLATAGGELSTAPDWSPDGRRIVYSSDAPGNSELYLLDIASGRNTRLTRSAAIETSPAFSPNGREIAFTSDRSGNPEIYVMDAEGLNVRRLTFRGAYNDSAAWSPEGDRLAYVSRVEGAFHVFVMDLSTGESRRLTRGTGNNEDPSWAPDGRHIVFSSDRAGRYDIYTMRADGTDVRRLTRGGDCFTPDWSR